MADGRRRGALIAAALTLIGLTSAPSSARAGDASTMTREGPEAPVIAGVVRRAGDRAPISGAAVLVVPEPAERRPGPTDAESLDASLDPALARRTESGADGGFRLEAPAGARARVIVMAPGYRRLDHVVALDRARRRPRDFFLEPQDDGAGGAYRTVVRERGDSGGDVSSGAAVRRSLAREELVTVPGSLGDPLLALQNMPGFARTPAGVGAVVIRGASPQQSRVFVGEHPVPRAFHLLPLVSVVPAPFIDRLDYEPGNFDSRYGDATAGVVRVQPRAGGREGYHGHAQLGLLSVGGSLEGPVGPGSFLVAARRGYTDLVLSAINDLTGSMFPDPSYFDYQARYDARLGAGAQLGVHLLGSGDRVPLTDAPEPRARSDFHLIDLEFRRRLGPYRVLISPAFRLDVGESTPRVLDEYGLQSAGFIDTRRDYIALLRAELARRWSRAVATTIGTDAQIDRFHTVYGSLDEDEERAAGVIGALGLYARATIEHGPLQLVPATRLSGFIVGARAGLSVDPRVTLRARLGERWSFTVALGQYSRAAYQSRTNETTTPSDVNPDYQPDGLALYADAAIPNAYRSLIDVVSALEPIEDSFYVARALHASVGARVEPSEAWSIDLVGFTRAQRGRGVLATPVSRAYGLELMVRRALTDKLYGWLTYTLLSAEELLYFNAGGTYQEPADFDQRHNLGLALSYALPRGWRLGGRFRLSSGLPYTPVVGGREIDFYDSGWLPVFGAAKSRRYPWFHQLDVRVDKRWRLRRTTVTAYLDVQNVYNGQPVELYRYSADFRARQGQSLLPILPTLGVRVDY